MLDISPAVHRHAGLGRYAGELLAALAKIDRLNDYTAFFYAAHGEKADGELARLPARTIRLSAKPWRLSVLLAYLTGRTMDSWFPAVDLFHGTDHLLPPIAGCRSVFTIHDLIFRFFPEYHLPLNRWYLSLMLPRFMARADAVIAVSETTRRDVIRLMHIPESKISVIYEGVSSSYQFVTEQERRERVRAKYKLPANFILFFSTIEPRKNLRLLLEAYAVLAKRVSALAPLVVAGKKGWLYQSTLARVRELGIQDRVTFTDWIEEEDVPALFSLADVFVYPSLYEGFGLPPLEAMACGVPVICSNASSLPEVVGDAAILFNPKDVGELAYSMERVLEDEELRRELKARGVGWASRFTWERTARATLRVYEQVSGAH